MSIHVGIDMGGTFTDAVAFRGTQLLGKAKVPTQSDHLLDTILSALEELGIQNPEEVTRINVSTTLVTNAILQNQLPSVDLFLFPGHGLDLRSFIWPVSYRRLAGEIDYRGREVQPPDELEWHRLAQCLNSDCNPRKIAIVGKFSHRNKEHEERLGAFLQNHCSPEAIAFGHRWGQANFYRRSLTTYLNLATSNLFEQFSVNLQSALGLRGYLAQVYILRADGGLVALQKLRPVESIYSGPAASMLGALAQNQPERGYLVIDIGGTTTDIGLILGDKPLLSTKGAQIGAFSTLIRTLAVRSVPVGSDTAVMFGDTLQLSNQRSGPAYCFGGPQPTPTDAMCYLGLVDFGDSTRAAEGLAMLLPVEQRDPANLRWLAEEILALMADEIGKAAEDLDREWHEEPAFKIWEVIHRSAAMHLHAWASGGAAQGLVPALNKRLRIPVYIGKHPEVSTAIGTALARPTFSTTLHLDTYYRQYCIEETGEQGQWTGSRRAQTEVAPFLQKLAETQAQDIEINSQEVIYEPFDFYPIIQGFETVGQIIRGAIHIPPGVMGRVTE